jgi:hypothetical protein
LAFTTIPRAEETLLKLSRTLDTAYAGLKHGVSEAQQHFKSAGITFSNEKQAFSSLVRLHTKDFLKKRNLESAELEHTNLCGIWLRAAGYHVKVWRVSEDDLKKASFPASPTFEQFQFLQDDEPIGAIPLRIYWHLDDRELLTVYLALPRYDDHKSAECYWLVPVPEPSLILEDTAMRRAGVNLSLFAN